MLDFNLFCLPYSQYRANHAATDRLAVLNKSTENVLVV